MKQKIQLLVLLLILIFVIGVSVLFVMIKNGTGQSFSNFNVSKNQTGDETKSGLPISPNHPGVVNVTSFYTIVGSVDKINNEKISLVSNGDKLPEFPLSEGTKYFVTTKQSGSTNSKFADIKSGDNVILTVSFDQEKLSWKTLRVTLNPINPLPAPASSSAIKK